MDLRLVPLPGELKHALCGVFNTVRIHPFFAFMVSLPVNISRQQNRLGMHDRGCFAETLFYLPGRGV